MTVTQAILQEDNQTEKAIDKISQLVNQIIDHSQDNNKELLQTCLRLNKNRICY